MPSRKRAQGKNRKEKNEARGPVERDVTYHRLARQDDFKPWECHCLWGVCGEGEQAENIRCSHGCVIPPRGHAVHNLMNTYENADRSALGGMTFAFEKHIEVLKDPVTRKMVRDIFLSMGTNCILRGIVEGACAMAGPILLIEHYNGKDHFLGPAMSSAMEKIGYICAASDGASERDTIHFYNKRIPCSCLKERYSQVKKCQERSGVCYRCKQLTNRKTLMACNGCKYAQYCSKECQVADWPSHKATCKQLCKYHKFVEKAMGDGGV